MKACFFGSYNSEYNRNSVIINGLQKNNVQVMHCNFRSNFFKRALQLIPCALKKDFDILFVLYPCHLDIWLAKIVALLKRKPLVIDKFVSQYDSELEYGNIKKNSVQALYFKFIDKSSCLFADKVFLDSKEQINYFVKEFSLPEKKFDWFFVGANEDRLKPRKQKKHKTFNVLFYGWVTPVQGFNFVVEAARQLASHKDIKFTFIGDSKYYRALRDTYSETNAEFIGIIPYNQLVKYIGQADALLAGHFGTTPKAVRVIPNKAFEGLAMKKPVVLSNTPLSRKHFKDKENIVFAKKGSAESIKKAIIFLKNNPGKAKRIALNGNRLFNQKFSSRKIGGEIKGKLQSFVPKPF